MNRLLIGSSNKTNLLLEMFADELPSLLIDPTGEIAPRAANLVPRKGDAFYFDPSDFEHPPGLNVFAGIEDIRQKDKLTQDLCAYFAAPFPDGEGTLTKLHATDLLANCIRTLLDTPNTTLLGVLKMLTNREYRNDCVKHCNDPVVRLAWEAIKKDPKSYQSAFAFLHTQMNQLLRSPIIRNIVGQKRTTLRRKIIIANLDRARIGDLTAKLLGCLLIARSTDSAYIHELPFFATDHMASLFPQDRFTVSLRSLTQVPPQLREELLAIETKFVSTVTRKDAEVLAPYVGVSNPQVLVDLRANEWRSLEETFVLEAPKSLRTGTDIRRQSRALHTVPREKVESKINQFLG